MWIHYYSYITYFLHDIGHQPCRILVGSFLHSCHEDKLSHFSPHQCSWHCSLQLSHWCLMENLNPCTFQYLNVFSQNVANYCGISWPLQELTRYMKAKLPAYNTSIICSPKVLAYGTPHSIYANFNPSFKPRSVVYQSCFSMSAVIMAFDKHTIVSFNLHITNSSQNYLCLTVTLYSWRNKNGCTKQHKQRLTNLFYFHSLSKT